jgi:hypothetical protein
MRLTLYAARETAVWIYKYESTVQGEKGNCLLLILILI